MSFMLQDVEWSQVRGQAPRKQYWFQQGRVHTPHNHTGQGLAERKV